MECLVDTTWFVDHLAEDPSAQQFLNRLAEQGFAMSIITYMELYQGACDQPDNVAALSKLSELVSSIDVLGFTRETAEMCARIRSRLKAQGRRFRPRALDLQIAATAITNGLTLVTQTIDDYKDIDGLSLYRPT